MIYFGSTPLGTICLGLSLLCSAACSDVPSNAQCEAFFDHVIDLEVNAGNASPEDKVVHKKKLREQKAKSFLEQCNTNIKASQIECSLKAQTFEEIEKCDQ